MTDKTPFSLYWDACVFVSLIEGDSARLPTIQAILDDVDRKKVEIFTSTLSIAEVAFAKVEKDGQILEPSIEAKIDKLWGPSSPFKMVDTYTTLMHEAKRLMRRVHETDGWSLKPADAIHLVTAQRVRVRELHTYDDKLYKFADAMQFPISAPRTDSFVFPNDSSPEAES